VQLHEDISSRLLQWKGLTSLTLSAVRSRAALNTAIVLLSKSSALSTLSIPSTVLGDVIHRVADTIESNTTVTSLELVSDIGMQTKGLLSALQRNRTITSLRLNGNKLDDRDAGQLGDVIRTHPTLSTLILSSNKLTLQGASVLAGGMKQSP
jgi:hypothetical protein